jgi:hypothetical protein
MQNQIATPRGKPDPRRDLDDLRLGDEMLPRSRPAILDACRSFAAVFALANVRNSYWIFHGNSPARDSPDPAA